MLLDSVSQLGVRLSWMNQLNWRDVGHCDVTSHWRVTHYVATFQLITRYGDWRLVNRDVRIIQHVTRDRLALNHV